MIHVPYKGTAPAVNDLLAGHVKVTFGATTRGDQLGTPAYERSACTILNAGAVRCVTAQYGRPNRDGLRPSHLGAGRLQGSTFGGEAISGLESVELD